MLRSASRPALWRYLDHLVSGISPAASDGAVAPQLHTELALILLEEALRLAAERTTTAVPDAPHLEDRALHRADVFTMHVFINRWPQDWVGSDFDACIDCVHGRHAAKHVD